jgi:phage terminase small subunit
MEELKKDRFEEIYTENGEKMSKKHQKMDNLTLKERKFMQEYILTGNATKAAKNAGYSENTAYSQSSRLLKNVEAQKALKSEYQKIKEEFMYSFVDAFREFEKMQTLWTL